MNVQLVVVNSNKMVGRQGCVLSSNLFKGTKMAVSTCVLLNDKCFTCSCLFHNVSIINKVII